MIGLNDRIPLELEIGTLSTLIAGLYCTYTATDPIAIPSSVYIELSEKLVPYLAKWNYDALSFEDWIKYNLLIVPKVMIEDSLEEFEKNEIYYVRDNGNIELVITASMSEVCG